MTPARAPLAKDDAARVRALSDWLLNAGARARSIDAVWQHVCDHLHAGGIPIDRATTQIRSLHSITSAVQRLWRPGRLVQRRDWIYTRDQAAYMQSPVRVVHETRDWLHRRLTPDSAGEFELFAELQAEGMTDYLCIPVEFTNATINIVSFATRRPDGFSDRDHAMLAALMPSLGLVLELTACHRMVENLTRTYLGRAASHRVLTGEIRRGELAQMNAAIMISDMREFTRFSELAENADTVRLLNAYYDCVIPPVEQSGGEVLKFMGDGVLAIFEDSDEAIGYGQSCPTALRAARRALGAIAHYNTTHTAGVMPMRVGIALHYGCIAFGNVGSGERLDFTAIGKDVNLASRIAAKCRDLGRDLLMSEDFAGRVRAPLRPQGDFDLRGVAVRQALYGLA